MKTIEDADAVLLYQGDDAVLIDTGEEQDARHILEVLHENNVDKLDYMILSHPDRDHIGGAMRILKEIPVGRVIEPYYTEENETLSVLNNWLEEQKISILYPTKTQRLKIGGMNFVVYPPLEKHYNDTNNYSLSVLVQHEKINMLFTGDALRKRSEELLYIDWPQLALYKVPHHGRANSMSAELFSVLRPTYALVTSGSADEIIIESASRMKTELIFTADGDAVFISDGSQLIMEEK